MSSNVSAASNASTAVPRSRASSKESTGKPGKMLGYTEYQCISKKVRHGNGIFTDSFTIKFEPDVGRYFIHGAFGYGFWQLKVRTQRNKIRHHCREKAI